MRTIYGVNAGLNICKKLVEHDCYTRLGACHDERCFAYCELFRFELEPQLVHDIQRASTFSMPLGDSQFKAQIELGLDRKLGYANRGRPTKRLSHSEND